MAEHCAQHMAECRAHALVVLPDWFKRVSRATVRALVLSKAGSVGYPTARMECATTCTCAMECFRSGRDRLPKRATRVDSVEWLRHRWSRCQDVKELLFRKDVAKPPLDGCGKRKSIDCREVCAIAVGAIIGKRLNTRDRHSPRGKLTCSRVFYKAR